MTNSWPNMAHYVSEVTADDRLFPRVMDWNIEHENGPLTHQQCSQINASVAAQACSRNKTFQDEICHFPAPFSPVPSLNQKNLEHVADTQVLKISNFVRNEQTSWMRAHSRGPREQLLSSEQPEPPSSEGFYRSPVVLSSINWQKRVEKSPMLTSATFIPSKTSISARKDEIAPYLARSLLTGYGAKQCSFDKCMKIAVSKGRCRGHGGGRRCQQFGCTKCAQSRSRFCWAHGGGKRCEAPNCRRSRKTKRFCVDHVEMELTRPFKSNGMAKSTPFKATKLRAASKSEMFSGKASETATAASNDGVERQLPISCAKEIQGIAVDVGSLQHRPCPQYTGEVTGLFQPSLQLPSLNEALHRTIPSRYFSDTIFSETRTPSPLAPYSCFCSSTAECDSSRVHVSVPYGNF